MKADISHYEKKVLKAQKALDQAVAEHKAFINSTENNVFDKPKIRMTFVDNGSSDNHGVASVSCLRKSQLIPAIVPISQSTLWRWVRDGKFPKPITLSRRHVVWRCDDVQEWIEATYSANRTP